MTSEIEKTTISAFENGKNLTEGKKERKKENKRQLVVFCD